MSKTIIEVETKTFIRFWLVLLGISLAIFLFYKALTGLLIIGISIFLAIAIRPLVHRLNDFFTRHFGVDKNHKTASAVFAYAFIVTLMLAIVAVIGPVVVNETSKFIEQIPSALNETLGGWDGINNFGKSIGIENLQAEIISAVGSFTTKLFGNLGSTVISSVSAIADIVTKSILVLVLTLLFLLEGPGIMNSLWRNLGSRKEDIKTVTVAKRIVSKMANVISTYVSHQALIAIFDGLASTLIVFVLSFIFKFSTSLAVPMGLITMLFYLIPMFGQVIGAALVAIVLAFSNPIAAIIFIVIYIIYAQIEGNAIAPKVQGNALNLPAVAILASITIGVYTLGLVGAIIAIPIAGCIRVLVSEYPNIKSIRE